MFLSQLYLLSETFLVYTIYSYVFHPCTTFHQTHLVNPTHYNGKYKWIRKELLQSSTEEITFM